jgi:hypothetical protein
MFTKNQISVKGLKVLEYLEKYPSFSSKYLAKLIYDENKHLFDDVENARDFVRYYRAERGPTTEKCLSPDHYIPKIRAKHSFEEKYKIITLDDSYFPLLIGADVHFPFHDQDALEIMLEYGLKNNIKTIFMNGDWLDFFRLSKFLIDPTKDEIEQELEMFKDILFQIRGAYPKDTKIIFKLGNHEERWDNYLMAHAPEMYKLPEMRLENRLDLKDFGVMVIGNKCPVKIRDLYIIHGHEYKFSISNPVNPARGLYLRAKKSAICNHFHQTSEHTETSISGGVTTCWSVGCLCGLHPDYMPINKWNLGFAAVYATDRGFTVENKRIVEYKIV